MSSKRWSMVGQGRCKINHLPLVIKWNLTKPAKAGASVLGAAFARFSIPQMERSERVGRILRAKARFSLEGFAGFVLTDSEKILRFFRLVIDYSGIERYIEGVRERNETNSSESK